MGKFVEDIFVSLVVVVCFVMVFSVVFEVFIYEFGFEVERVVKGFMYGL